MVKLRSLELREGRFHSADDAFSCEPAALERIDIASERYVYVSDIQPAEVELTPFLDVAWPPRMDRCVAGGPLALGERTYPKGIGTGTRTLLTYELTGRYDWFLATVGVDRAAGRRGHVVSRVLLDGKEAFSSPMLHGGSDPVPVKVELKDASRITLVSDFGSELRADGDFGDWVAARLVRRKTPAGEDAGL
jgi:hypothetical protein